MKILCVCDIGNNRSVHFASQLKFWKHDTIAIGLDTTTQETLKMLYEWADIILLTENMQRLKMPEGYEAKIKFCDVGIDIYPRPYNAELLAKVRGYLEDNKSWLKN